MSDLAGRYVLTAAQMRALEGAAMRDGVASLELMERAGNGVVRAISAWLAGEGGLCPPPAAPPEVFGQKRRALVICGPGNNGGDGYVVARLLAGAGWQVEVVRFGPIDGLSPEARANMARCADIGLVPGEAVPGGAFDLAVDAGFGIGVRQPFRAPEVLRVGLARARWRVAVDLPSGLCSDTGRAGDGVSAVDLTVTFHAPKAGHVIGAGPDLCGALAIADIGLAPWQDEPSAPPLPRLVAPPAGVAKRGGHKFDHGAALVVTGGMGRTGAARLAARGALRVGAGLVTLAAPGAAMLECAGQISALMLRRCDDAGALEALMADARITALCLGPGLGLARARALVPAALRLRRACVLDADALSAFEHTPDALFAQLHPGCVLTPHGGEFARLWPDLARNWRGGASKIDSARAAAERAGAVVVLKGADTVIAAPDGQVAVQVAGYGRAAPWLATAGAGDVLAGLITGLMARGQGGFAAAQAGVWLHLEAARGFGPGLIAEDLPDLLPQVLRGLEKG